MLFRFVYFQFHQSPPKHGSSCRVWLNGEHPKVQDGIVSRTLCAKNETNDYSATIDVYIRKCASYYVYNFRDLRNSSGLIFCLRNGEISVSS